MYKAQSILILKQIGSLPLKVLRVRDQAPINMDGPDDPTSRTTTKLLTEIIQLHRLLQSGFDYNPKFILGSP